MSDTLTVKGSSGAQFTPHPEGQFVAQCVDVIDLGEKVEEFPGTPAKLAPKCVLVFRSGERNEVTGDFIDIAREFSISMNEKANLRKFLEQWRGRPYTAAQVQEGVPLHKLTGQHALISVAHKVSTQGRTYANLAACVGVPKQMAGQLADMQDGYKRADYWATRKAEYAEGARKFKAEAGVHVDDEFPSSLKDEEDDLPFNRGR